MAPWIWSLILLGIGLLIIAVEMFVPSGGILGILSGLCILGAIAIGFVSSLSFGTFMLILVAVLMPIVFAAAVRYWPDTPIGRLIVIRPPTSDEVLPDAEARRNLQTLIGKQGIAKCPMLPGGVVMVEGRSYDAVSDGTPVDTGQAVKVIAVRMNRLEVRLADPTGPDGPTPSQPTPVLPHPMATAPTTVGANPVRPDQVSPDRVSPDRVSPDQAAVVATQRQRLEEMLSEPLESLGIEPLNESLNDPPT